MGDTVTQQANNNEDVAKKMILSILSRQVDNKLALQWQMDLSLTVANILMKTGGFYYDKVADKIYKYDQCSLNATGVLRLAEILDSYLNKDTIQSNLSLGEIKRIMLGLCKTIPIEFYENRDQYGVDMVRFPLTMYMVSHSIFLALKRAYNDGTRKHNETIQTIQETYSNKEENKEGKKFLSR